MPTVWDAMSDQDLIHRWLSQAELEQMLNDAYAKGADAMREAAATAVYSGPTWLAVADIARAIRALPVPGKKP
jgi:hypothetical protein